MKWILIYWIMLSPGKLEPFDIATATQEFSREADCRAAADAMDRAMHPYTKFGYVCVRDGDGPLKR